jgi:hypothetical protein
MHSLLDATSAARSVRGIGAARRSHPTRAQRVPGAQQVAGRDHRRRRPVRDILTECACGWVARGAVLVGADT